MGLIKLISKIILVIFLAALVIFLAAIALRSCYLLIYALFSLFFLGKRKSKDKDKDKNDLQNIKKWLKERKISLLHEHINQSRISFEILQEAFPDVKIEVLEMCWSELKEDREIERSSLGGYVIKPACDNEAIKKSVKRNWREALWKK